MNNPSGNQNLANGNGAKASVNYDIPGYRQPFTPQNLVPEGVGSVPLQGVTENNTVL